MKPVALALLSTLCFGAGMLTARVGLRHLDARAGAALSIPSALLLFLFAAPFTIDWTGFNTLAVLIFAAVGLFYPASVTLMTFRSNETLGPTVTSAISGTAPLFAMCAAALLLGEHIPPQALLAALAVTAGVALLSWRPGALRGTWPRGALLWPVAGAVVRGLAQTGAKAGLLLWASPFAASVVGYLVSAAAVSGLERSRGAGRRRANRQARFWFTLTGIINGSAMVLMYGALAGAPVSTVAPIIAAYPLVTVIGSALFLRGERITIPMAAGTLLTVSAIAWLAAARGG